jgi:SagB-type dehydrogenase family enzyme
MQQKASRIPLLRAILNIRYSILSLAFCSIFTIGCTQNSQQTLKKLNEIPVEQLRVFLRGFTGDWRTDTDKNRGIEAPPAQTPLPQDAKIIDLPAPDSLNMGTMTVDQAIRQRRSRREYTETPLTLEELSFLLLCTQGVSSFGQDSDGSIISQYRTVPSGGSRHPFETYLLIQRVKGLEPGVYRFLPFGHKLALMRADEKLQQTAMTACYGQSFVGEAAVIFVWAAVPYRTEWKYGCIAHRMIAIEAGHICQNLYLAAESINVGTCALLGYSQPHMDTLIDVDGKDEFTVYMAAIGKLKRDSEEK